MLLTDGNDRLFYTLSLKTLPIHVYIYNIYIFFLFVYYNKYIN